MDVVRIKRYGLLTVFLLQLGLCSPPRVYADSYTIKFTDKGFLPRETLISVEDTVRFTNNSTKELKLIASPTSTHPEHGNANLGLIEPIDGLGVMQFTKPGTHTFLNESYPEFTGTIIVSASKPKPTSSSTTEGGAGENTSLEPTQPAYQEELLIAMDAIRGKVLAAKDDMRREQSISMVALVGGILFVILNLGFAGYMLYTKSGSSRKTDTQLPSSIHWERKKAVKKLASTQPAREDQATGARPTKLDDLDRWIRRN